MPRMLIGFGPRTVDDSVFIQTDFLHAIALCVWDRYGVSSRGRECWWLTSYARLVRHRIWNRKSLLRPAAWCRLRREENRHRHRTKARVLSSAAVKFPPGGRVARSGVARQRGRDIP